MRAATLVALSFLLALPGAAQEEQPEQPQEQPPPPQTEPPRSVTVRVISTPPRATVEVLGRGEVGRTPIRRLELPVGEYDFVFTRRGYARSVVHVNVTEDQQTIGSELQRAGRIAVRADHLPARGATVRIDGQLAGTVPETFEVAPGRRLVEVEADGYLTYGRWVDVEEARRVTVNVRLEERPPDTGSILVTADVSQAEVTVDGESRGNTPAVVEGLLPGQHLVTVTGPEGESAERTVDVRANAREVVAFELAPQPDPPGVVAVTSEPAGATVVVDGENRGTTPLTLEQMTPGQHRIEISSDGYEATERIVTVTPGQREELSVTLERGAQRPGRIMVATVREDVFVIVDGLSRGRAPITLEHVPPGTHTVRLQAEGMEPHESECVIRFGETCTIETELRPAEVPVRVQARSGGAFVRGGALFVDGEHRGTLPWEGTLAPGTYEIEARAEGYQTSSQQLEVQAGTDSTLVSLPLEPAPPPEPEPPAATPDEPPEPEPAAPVERGRLIARDSAVPFRSGHGHVALFLGWPYLAGAEVAVGLPVHVDLSLALRTFGRLTELEAGARLGWAPADIVGLGLRLRVSAGLGPDPGDLATRSTVSAFGAKLDGAVTLWPIEAFAISAWLGADFTTDDYPYAERDDDQMLVGVDRQNLARLRVGGSVAYRFHEGWSVHLRFEGILASSGDRRRIYGDVIGIGNPDTEAYGELGAGYAW